MNSRRFVLALIVCAAAMAVPAAHGSDPWPTKPIRLVVAPAGTPREVVERINQAARKALDEPDVAARLRELNAYAEPRSPDAFSKFMQRESAIWTRIIAPLNMQLD